MTTAYTALDIAKWFVNATDRESGDDMTHLKVQKLLYYAQGWYLANYDEDLFSEEMEAWVHGPVAPSVWNNFKTYGFDSIPPQQITRKINSRISGFLEMINEEYGIYSAKRLEKMTHSEKPWLKARGGIALDARCNNVIDKKVMKKFFESQIEED